MKNILLVLFVGFSYGCSNHKPNEIVNSQMVNTSNITLADLRRVANDNKDFFVDFQDKGDYKTYAGFSFSEFKPIATASHENTSFDVCRDEKGNIVRVKSYSKTKMNFDFFVLPKNPYTRFKLLFVHCYLKDKKHSPEHKSINSGVIAIDQEKSRCFYVAGAWATTMPELVNSSSKSGIMLLDANLFPTKQLKTTSQGKVEYFTKMIYQDNFLIGEAKLPVPSDIAIASKTIDELYSTMDVDVESTKKLLLQVDSYVLDLPIWVTNGAYVYSNDTLGN